MSSLLPLVVPVVNGVLLAPNCLGAGADVVKFANTAAANGVDTITNFTAGDKLNFKSFETSLAVGNLAVITGQALTTDKQIHQTTINDAIALKDYGDGNFTETESSHFVISLIFILFLDLQKIFNELLTIS